MDFAFTFNSLDTGNYGLVVEEHDIPSALETESVQLPDCAYPFDSKRPAITIKFAVSIMGDSKDEVKDNKAIINKALNILSDAELILDEYPDYYWNARFSRMNGKFVAPRRWQGVIEFIAHDPIAYDIDETSSPFDIDADPKTVSEAAGGDVEIKPVYTLTAGSNLGSVTITLENETADEGLTWAGTMTTNDELEIDVANQVVKKNGTESMSGLDPTSKFPRLEPDVSNSIKITGFGATGALNIKYRNGHIV